jgi:hypothetical protein
MQPPAPADLIPMRDRRLLSALVAVLAAGSLGVAASGCGSGGASATLDPIAQAADATSRAGGSQVAISATVQVPGLSSPLKMTGGGHFNDARREGSITLSMEGFPAGSIPGVSGGTLTMSELMKDNVVYITSPLFDGKLPNGAKWLKIDLDKALASLGIDPQALTSGGTDPGQILSYLKGSTGSPKIVGHEAVRGVQTTHYEGAVSLESLVETLPQSQRAKAREAVKKLSQQIGGDSFPVSVWIDAHHLVRRMTMDLHISNSGQSAGMHMEIENFGFGPTPTVTPPASSEIFDGTGLSSSALSAGA